VAGSDATTLAMGSNIRRRRQRG